MVMYNLYGVGTLDDLIKNIETKIRMNDLYNDNLYLTKLKEFLEYNIMKTYGNIPTVASFLPTRSLNYIKSTEWKKEKKKIAEYFENIERLKTNSRKYYLISVENYNGSPVLIIGAPDGSHFGGKINNEAKIYEIKSYNLMYSYNIYGPHKGFIKKVLDIIYTTSNQLIVYEYLLKNTIQFGLIEKIEKSELKGILYFHSENIEDIYSAIRILKQNYNEIIKDASKYNAYNLILKEEEKICINGENIYYFKISFRVRYDKEVIEKYLKNLYKLLKSLKIVE